MSSEEWTDVKPKGSKKKMEKATTLAHVDYNDLRSSLSLQSNRSASVRSNTVSNNMPVSNKQLSSEKVKSSSAVVYAWHKSLTSPITPTMPHETFHRIFHRDPPNNPSSMKLRPQDLRTLTEDGVIYVLPSNVLDRDVMGVSHFTIHHDFDPIEVHRAWSVPKKNACHVIADGIIFPDGLSFKKEGPAPLMNKLRNYGTHVAVFPTVKMTLDEFTDKLKALYNITPCCMEAKGTDGNIDDEYDESPFHNETPVYPKQQLLFLVSQALYEMSLNPNVPPDCALRCLMFHYRLADEGFSYDDILKGDALSVYCAKALDLCANHHDYYLEARRNQIRVDLGKVVQDEPCIRTMDDDDDDDDRATSMKIVFLADEISDLPPHTRSNPSPSINFALIDMNKVHELLKNIYVRGLVDVFISSSEIDVSTVFVEQYCSFKRDVEIESMLDVSSIVRHAKCSVACGSLFVKADELVPIDAKSVQSFLESGDSRALKFFLAGVHYFREDCKANFLVATTICPSSGMNLKVGSPGIFVSFFGTDIAVSMNRSKFICEAISKYVDLLKQEVWQVQEVKGRRSIVMFLSKDHIIELNKALPGPSDFNRHQRHCVAEIFRKHGLIVKKNKVTLQPTGPSCATVVICVNGNLHDEIKKVTRERLFKFGLPDPQFWEEKKQQHHQII
jgi:hypothetical protein